MNSTYWILAFTAASISIIHTASGPDHYVPFIVLSRSRKWNQTKTITLTMLCGLGHVFSSVLLGLIGVYLGWHLNKITWLQDMRGNISGWALLIFGLCYLLYGLRYAYLNPTHKHFDVISDDVYVFEHKHGEVVMPGKRVKVTPLILFIIFVMGPSEPLIPLLFFSGTNRSIPEIVVLISVFTICTVLTMLVMVMLGCNGYGFVKTEKIERYLHALGGGIITLCAAGMVFFGW